MRMSQIPRTSLAPCLALASLAACGGLDAPGGLLPDDDAPVASVAAAVTCNPVVVRYPVAGPHNHGYDLSWNSWGCSTANSNTDYSSAHLGNDIFGALGTPIVAAQGGTVSTDPNQAVGGKVVYVVDACGWTHYYAHLDTIDPGLVNGAQVKPGQRLGTLGKTGNAQGTEPHLHYSIYPGAFANGIDPHPYLKAVVDTACTSGNRCSCEAGTNVKGYPIPVTDTDCSHRVCGTSSELFECGTGNAWVKVGGVGSCSAACSCPGGKFEDGRDIPAHMTHCGFRVCGMDLKLWDCTSTGAWVSTNIACGDGMNGNRPAGATNYARTAISVSTDSNYSASFAGDKAKDGLVTAASKWTSTGATSTHWLVYDLGASRTVNGYVVRHASAAGEPAIYNTKLFQIQTGTSTAGPWTTQAIVDNPKQLGVSFRSYVTPRSVRYVRLYITNPGGDAFARIPEFEVWGN